MGRTDRRRGRPPFHKAAPARAGDGPAGAAPGTGGGSGGWRPRGRRGATGGWRPRRGPSLARRVARLAGLAVVLLALAGTGVVAFAAITPLPKPEVPQATVIYDIQGRVIASLHRQNREIAGPEEIPRALRQAVVAAEDARFYRHHGFDPVAIGRAAVRNLQAGRIVEGGSSITQQLARTLYDLSLERTFARKLQEALLAVKLETRYSKDQILTMYLNQVYFGRGAYGVKVAAREYFGKPLSQLSLAEAATLAAFIRGPEVYWRDPERARGRRDWVLSRMAELGMITPEAARRAQAEPLVLRPPGEPDVRAPYFVDYVRERLAEEVPGLAGQLYTGGYRIYTTLDLDVQAAAERAAARLDDLVAPLGERNGVPQPQVALVALDPATGGIRAMVGGRDFRTTRFNRAVRARRQPGSAFKPFLYTAVLASGEPVTAPMACRARTYPGEEPGQPYTPRDYGTRPYHDAFFDIRHAVAISDNLVAVEWMNRIKPRRVADLAHRMGIESELKRTHLGLALGDSEVTPLEMARAYATLANLGERVEPFAVLRVEDRDGTMLFSRRPRRQRVLAPEVAWLMTDVLKSVFDPEYGGTARALGIGRPAAGKTGTTDDSRDAWFVGYTPDLVAAVWVGSDDHDQRVTLPNGAGATASSTAGRIWQSFMAAALAGRPPRDWPRPDGVVRAPACTLTGPLDAPRFEWRDEWFLAGHVPEPNCLALLEEAGLEGWERPPGPGTGPSGRGPSPGGQEGGRPGAGGPAPGEGGTGPGQQGAPGPRPGGDATPAPAPEPGQGPAPGPGPGDGEPAPGPGGGPAGEEPAPGPVPGLPLPAPGGPGGEPPGGSPGSPGDPGPAGDGGAARDPGAAGDAVAVPPMPGGAPGPALGAWPGDSTSPSPPGRGGGASGAGPAVPGRDPVGAVRE